MNFIKNQIQKFATLAIIIGVGVSCIGLWQMFSERNVASEPEIMDVANLNNPSGGLVYATVTGGTADLTNTFEYSIKRKKRTTLVKTYFVPVVDSASNNVAYILGTDQEPGYLGAANGRHTGLLQNNSSLPNKLKDSYSELFPGQSFPYLDATYKPRSMFEKFSKIGLFLGIAIMGLLVRLSLGRKAQAQLA